MSAQHECQRCGELRRAVVVHPALTSPSGPVLWCRPCMQEGIKERKRCAPSTPGPKREAVLESVEKLRRAAAGPSYAEPDERQGDLFAGAR